MKPLKYFLLLIAALPGLMIANAQTAEEIIAKHIDAIGGKDKISQIKSIFTESTIFVMDNNGQRITNLLAGKGFKGESDFNGQKVTQCFTDKSGWVINPNTGTQAQDMPEGEYKAGRDLIYVGGTLSSYSARGGKVELIGKENVGPVGAYKIKETDPDGISAIFYIDQNTYYLLEVVRNGTMNGQNVEITITQSNFQKTSFGFTAPFKIGRKFGEQFTMSETINKMEFNKDIDHKIFDMPR
ncbi:MAG TPA: hypothetical protein VII44_07750 [Puia sp.]